MQVKKSQNFSLLTEFFLVFLLFNPVNLLGWNTFVVRGDLKNGLLIDNGVYFIGIGGEKSSKPGMITELKLHNSNFNFSADIGDYNLFFPEFHVVWKDFRPSYPGVPGYYRGDLHGTTRIARYWEKGSFLYVKVKWINGWIDAEWLYAIPYGKNFFTVDIERIVRKGYVYTNYQQCTMVNPDMKVSYIVDEMGQFVKTFDAEKGYMPSTCKEYIMFGAIDRGMAKRYPAFAWYDPERNVSIGMITTWVSSNQRKVISYHGGGSSLKHPGFGEGQWNWFGDADDGSKYLPSGTRFGMEIVYVVGRGDPEEVVDKFNRRIFRESIDRGEKIAPDIFTAGWGGRRSMKGENWKYNYNFPTISGNWVSDHFLFAHNSFILPWMKNGVSGVGDAIFSIWVKGKKGGKEVNLTPVYDPDKKPVEMGGDGSYGWVRWYNPELKVWTKIEVSKGKNGRNFTISSAVTGNTTLRPFIFIKPGRNIVFKTAKDGWVFFRKGYGGICVKNSRHNRLIKSGANFEIPFTGKIALNMVVLKGEENVKSGCSVAHDSIMFYRDLLPPSYLGGRLPYGFRF